MEDIKQVIALQEEPAKVDKFLGIYTRMTHLDKFTTTVAYSQKSYCDTLCNRYMEELGVTTLPKRSVPTIALNWKEIMEGKTPGKFAKTAPKHIGGLLFLARGGRADILFATVFLSRYESKWCTWNDDCLHQIFCFLCSPDTVHAF